MNGRAVRGKDLVSAQVVDNECFTVAPQEKSGSLDKGRNARLLFDLTRICAERSDRGPMASPASPPIKIRFDSFELDVTSGELRKGGNRLRLQPQPFRVLLLLIERPGQVVTREEIQRCLWKDSTFVDFEHGINFSIKTG
jgi:DNA-binding response OmpR family regulator